MSSIKATVFIFVLLGTLRAGLARMAPGDHDETCRTGRFSGRQNNFQENNVLLIDSYDYSRLYGTGNSPWMSLDKDGDGNSWTPNFGGNCQQNMLTCTYRNGPQENWLVSQFIKYQDANEIFIEFSYRFSRCTPIPACKDFVTLYRYDSDVQVSVTERIDTSRYTPLFGDEVSSRLQPPPGATSQVSTTLDLTRPEPRMKGFYLGIKDTGTCGEVNRMTIHYNICPASQNELVVYPEVATPPKGGPDAVFQAQCVDNAHSTTSLEINAFSGNSTCMDQVFGGARCECDGGYQIADDRRSCEACPAGTYRTPGLSNTCQQCPDNTDHSGVAAISCPCLSGFFRSNNPKEGPQHKCSEPPTEVCDLRVTNTNDTSITLEWNRPKITGRNDYYYEIVITDTSDGTTTTVDSMYSNNGTTVTYVIHNLKPATRYTIAITTHNGVSGQDNENKDRRTATGTGVTTEGVPSPPELNPLCTVLTWSPPTEPAGVIIAYEIRFQESDDTIVSFGADVNFHITEAAQRSVNALVQIRAENSFAKSQWSEPLSLGCDNPIDCPTSETVSQITVGVDSPCEPLSAPTHGFLLLSQDEAEYSCDEGFQMVGEAERTCLENGRWSGAAPTCVPPCKLLPVHFVLGDEVLANNSAISLQQLGEGAASLAATTTYEGCCRRQRIGEFFYQNDQLVGLRNAAEPFYRNRGEQEVRLHYRGGAVDESLLGEFSCKILDGCGDSTFLYIHINN